MNKKLILIALLLVVSLSQLHVRGKQHRQGGVVDKTKQQILAIQQNPKDEQNRMYFEAKELAISQWEGHTQKKLGKLKTFSEQIVSGIIFRFSFQSADNADQIIQMGVWSQPWTSTLKVMYVLPAIKGWTQDDGNVADKQSV